MFNQVLLIGRLVEEPELHETSDGKVVTTIRVAVQRPFKNQERNEYDTDFINCTLWQNTAENTSKYAVKGAILSIKGRIREKQRVIDDDKKINMPEIVAERVTFIAKANNEKK